MRVTHFPKLSKHTCSAGATNAGEMQLTPNATTLSASRSAGMHSSAVEQCKSDHSTEVILTTEFAAHPEQAEVLCIKRRWHVQMPGM